MRTTLLFFLALFSISISHQKLCAQEFSNYKWADFADPFFILENPPEINLRNRVRAVRVFEAPVDSTGAKKKPEKLSLEYVFDHKGQKILERHFAADGRVSRSKMLIGPRPGFPGHPPIYEKIVYQDSLGMEKASHQYSLYPSGDTMWVRPYRFFKPCYHDYLFSYHQNGLKKSGFMVVPKGGIILVQENAIPWKFYRFEYEFYSPDSENQPSGG